MQASVSHSRCTPRRVTRTLELSRTQLRRPARRVVTRSGNKVSDLVKIGSSVVESAAELVPSSVPRPLAKVGVAVFGVSIVFWLLQKVLTTALTLALLAGGAFLWFKASSSNEDGGDGGDGSGSDGDDALSEARRIMDKYK